MLLMLNTSGGTYIVGAVGVGIVGGSKVQALLPQGVCPKPRLHNSTQGKCMESNTESAVQCATDGPEPCLVRGCKGRPLLAQASHVLDGHHGGPPSVMRHIAVKLPGGCILLQVMIGQTLPGGLIEDKPHGTGMA